MTLDKRTGLYSIPSHHLHGAKPASRPTFNSMDFAAEETGLRSAEVDSLPQVKEGENATTSQEHKGQKKEKKESISTEDKQSMSNRPLLAANPLIKVTSATASTKGKNDKSATNADKKRKRKSGDNIGHAPKPSSDGGFVVGADMLQNVQSSVKAASEVFSRPKDAGHTTEQPHKKSKKDKVARKSTDTVDFDLIAKETRAMDKKARREKKMKRRSAEATQVLSPPIFSSLPPRKTSVPISPYTTTRNSTGSTDILRATERNGEEEKGPKQHTEEAISTTVDLSSPPPSRKTAVPLPQNAFSHAVNATKAERIGRRDSRLLALDTPPSQLPKTPVNLRDSPIPCKLTDAIKTRKNKSSKIVADPSPPTPFMVEPPSSAPPALNKSHKLELTPDGRVSLTASNLMKYTTKTEPLSDRPKPRPKTQSHAASTAGSTTSGGTTPSIADLFLRVGKPYTRSSLENDPFVAPAPTKKKKVHLETHVEANAATFTGLYATTQRAVNFSDEVAYHEEATAWRQANASRGPLSCLGQKASGCNSKRETILRLTRDDPTSQLKVSIASEDDVCTLASAKQRAEAAENFLSMAIRARVPVPLGPMEGTWLLFCPAYSEAHVDKYGYGQRVLRIFSAPYSSHSSTEEETGEVTFTARLSIPPRSMLYPLLSFAPPPHASFRTTTLRTSAEGYKMDVVFLGNGYLLLRVDLRLLLSGKEGERGTMMEFLGVHERAVRWEEQGDEVEELEKTGKKLFEKYDGVAQVRWVVILFWDGGLGKRGSMALEGVCVVWIHLQT